MVPLGVSLFAVLVSLVSLSISYLSFQRDKPRVSATISRERHSYKGSRSVLLHIRLVNSGARPIQVDTRRFENEDNPSLTWGLSQDEWAGPDLPVSLSGYSSIDWWVDVRSMLRYHAEREKRTRAIIALGSGKVISTAWIAPALSDDPGQQQEIDELLSKPTEPGKGPQVAWR
jgi:hypothetical protein